MRAEMTVGLDLKKLEDLKIFNGYDTLEWERNVSVEARSSSPELDDNGDDSDSHQQTGVRTKRSRTDENGTKQKCGRPSNPVPRHKRESHIKAEYKRRDKIQKGFDSLMSMVPSLIESSASKESKSSMLFKTAEYCRRLTSEYGDVESEMRALRQELESLGTEIHDLQDKLPKQGASVVDKETLQLDGLYDAYVEQETARNWKFWIFGFFMKPLYKSYRVAVTGTYNSLEFSKVVIEWVKDAMSLSSLRQGFLESLRKVSTQTDIMYHPELLQKEAASKASMHCIRTEPQREEQHQDVVYRLTPTALANTPKTTPKTTPRQTPKVTPVPTPTPTPPQTPTPTRRNKRRETHVSKERRSRPNSPQDGSTRVSKKSRSRSNSPQDGCSRVRRRPSNRSEKRHYSGDVEDHSPMMFTNAISKFTFTQPTGQPAKRASPVHAEKNKLHHGEVNPTFSNNAGYSDSRSFSNNDVLSSINTKLPSPLVSYANIPFTTSPPMSKPDEKLLTTFIGSLASFLQTDQKIHQAVEQEGMSDRSSTVFTCSDANMSVDHQSLLNENHMEASIESSANRGQSGFLPIDRAGLITSNSFLSVNQSLLDPAGGSLLSELSPISYDDYTSSQSDNLSVLTSDQVSLSFTPSTSASLNTYNSSVNEFSDLSYVAVKQEGQNVLANDEDSLMKMLSLDVLDVNSVMTFFGSEQSQTKLSKPSDC